MIRAKNIFKE